eukprot:5568506-Pyramimonas_sp.AAC.1
MAARSTEAYSMSSVSDGEFEETGSVSDPISVPGQDAVFASGQHSGLSYGRVLRDAPDCVNWGRKVNMPSEDWFCSLGGSTATLLGRKFDSLREFRGRKFQVARFCHLRVAPLA